MDLVRPESVSAEIENQLKHKIQDALKQRDTLLAQQVLAKITEALQVEPIQIAAAILCMEMPHHEWRALMQQLSTGSSSAREAKAEQAKLIRYRIEVGQMHKVSPEDIRALFINESGVEAAKIGPIDIRTNYTLIDLPYGMPPDIFQHLQSVEIKQQALKIKRVGLSKKRRWHSGNQRRKS